jgi:hypothetical protein
MSFIEGLKIKISADELRELLQKNAAHHEERADHYARRYAADKELIEEEETAASMSNSMRKNLLTSEKQHRLQAAHFRFLAEHLMDVDYHLTNADLSAIGIGQGW